MASQTTQADGLTFAAYPGDGAVLLAFDAGQGIEQDLAGFAVEYTDPDGQTFPVLNRLNFAQPLQKFHWVHFPPDVKPGTFTYKATAMLFQPGSETSMTAGPSAELGVTLMPQQPGPFRLGFTRGYISSQAYAEQFRNAPIEPTPPTFDFDTTPYQAQYQWLGFHARRLITDFVAEALADQGLGLDVFAYDFDEPDIIRQLGRLGPRLRLYLDDSASPTGDTAREPKAHDWLTAQGAQVKVGHFQRFSHDKVLIQKRGDTALRVLSGSANFSVRGLYVQSNNVFTFDDPATAALYEQAFQQSWDNPSGFAASQLAASWHDCGGHDGLPGYSVCLSPHHRASVSLDRVASAVTSATSSGTTQRLDGSLKVQKSGDPAGTPFIPFSYLSDKVPAPFRAEWDGGIGQVIHHKFVVTDFNGENPLVFAGSSNLAAGGEEQNGDNLVCFTDHDIAAKYAIEAIQLVDHYRFRAAMKQATDAQPLQLKPHSAYWASDYYAPGSPKNRERTLLAGH